MLLKGSKAHTRSCCTKPEHGPDDQLNEVAKEDALPLPEIAVAAPPPYTATEIQERFNRTLEPDPALTAIGKQLYEILAQGGVKDRLEALNDSRLILDLPDDLHHLPWELITHDLNRFFMNIKAPVCRGKWDALRPLGMHTWPLRLLVVVGSESSSETIRQGQLTVNAAAELAKIRDAIAFCGADVDLEECIRQPKAEVMKHIERFKPHILHYIGHGLIYNDRPALELRSDSFDFWNADSIFNDIRRVYGDTAEPDRLRLVVLNACRSGSPPQDQRDPWSLSAAFLMAGVPAVVGMSSDIADRSAACFAGSLYRDLATGASIDEAMASARNIISSSSGDDLYRREWAAPCLQVRCDPASVIQIGVGSNIQISTDWRRYVSSFPGLDRLHHLVDRRRERYEAWQGFEPHQRKVRVIFGEAGAGKTKFAHMLMERCALCHHELRYVDMKGRGNDFLSLLLAIRSGSSKPAPSPLNQALPATDFAGFYQELGNLLSTQITANGRPVTVHEDVASANRAQDRDLLIQLRQFFDTRFSEDELRTVCFDLGIDYDNLAGMGKAGKARELVAYYERNSRIPELLAVARQLRPGVSWPDAADQHQPAEQLSRPDNEQRLVMPNEHYRKGKFGQLFSTFRAGLQAVARPDRPLVLVIDHLELADPEFEVVHEGLFAPFTAPRNPNDPQGSVNIVLLLTTQRRKLPYGLERRLDNYEPFELKDFPGALWSELVDEFFRRTFAGQQVSANRMEFIESKKKLPVANEWRPALFDLMLSEMEAFGV